jgi:hypothetical protein
VKDKAIWGLSYFYMSFRIDFLISVKDDTGIFMGIALNLLLVV